MQDMTTGSTTKRIVLFAIPLLFGNLLQQVYSMVDTVVVGRFVGYQALASVGVTVEVVSLLLGLALGMSNGVSVITAQFFGAKQMEKVRKSVAMGVLLCGITAVVIGVIGVFFARPIYMLLGTPADIMDGAVLYTTIMFAGAPATLLYNYVSSVLRAFGDSKTPLFGLAIASLVNIVLDLLFVVGFHWDIAGVGIATLISQLLAGVFCSVYAMKRLPFLRFQTGDFAWERRLVASQLGVGIPLAFQQSVLAVGRLYMQAILNTLGTLTIAAYTVVSRIDMFLYSCMSAFGIATTTYAAQNFGAKRIDRIDRGVKGACVVTVSICIGFTAAANLFALPIITAFVGAQEQAVIEMGVQYIRLATPFYPLLGVIFVMHSAEQGIGKAVFAMMASFVELVARPVAAVTLTAGFGYAGFCFTNPAAWGSAFLMVFISYLLIMRKMKKQQQPFRLTHKQEAVPQW